MKFHVTIYKKRNEYSTMSALWKGATFEIAKWRDSVRILGYPRWKLPVIGLKICRRRRSLTGLDTLMQLNDGYRKGAHYLRATIEKI